jgi:hypothetical protein
MAAQPGEEPMSGNWDASIKLVYAVDDGAFFTLDTVDIGKEFDVIANVEVGTTLLSFSPTFDLWVTVLNLSKSTTAVPTVHLSGSVAQTTQELRVDIPGGWTADDGDVLEVVAAFKVAAGQNTDYSSAVSGTFIADQP